MFGSLAYVREHFGSFENPKPEYATLDAYLNIDSGTGHPRGAGVFGPPGAAAILRQTLAPFADLGVVGASATNLDNYERIIDSDVKDAAVVIAATLYQLAMRDQMVPRFAPSDMPPPVQRSSSAQ